MKAKNRFGKRQVHRIESARGWAHNADFSFKFALDTTLDDTNRIAHLFCARQDLREATAWLEAAIKAIEEEGVR